LNFKKETSIFDFVKKSLGQTELYPFQKELIKLIESDKPIVFQLSGRRRNWNPNEDIEDRIKDLNKNISELANQKVSEFEYECDLALKHKLGRDYKKQDVIDRCTLVSYQNNPKLENFNIDGVTMLVVYNRNTIEKMQIHRLYKGENNYD